MKKIIKWTGIVLGGLIGLTLVTAMAVYPSGKEKLTRAYPNLSIETVSIPTDPDAVARGKHIAIVWACTKCHGEDLNGMLQSNDLIQGTITSANLTSGKGGIGGSYTDTDWVRAIRHGVKPNSRVEVMMYNYSAMSDQELGALIAYLKQIPPIDSDLPAMSFGLMIPVAQAVGLFTPAAEVIDHAAPLTANPEPGATVAYGKSLFILCAECHSSNLVTKLEKWNQEDFMRTVRTGVLPKGRQLPAAMSSKNFSEMNDTELTALWLYLQSLQTAK